MRQAHVNIYTMFTLRLFIYFLDSAMFYFIYLFYLFPLTYISRAYLCECVISCSHSRSLTLLPLTLIAHSGSCGAGRHRLKHLSTSPFIPQSGSERQESCLNSPTWLLLWWEIELAYAGTFLFLFFFFLYISIFPLSPWLGWCSHLSNDLLLDQFCVVATFRTETML